MRRFRHWLRRGMLTALSAVGGVVLLLLGASFVFRPTLRWTNMPDGDRLAGVTGPIWDVMCENGRIVWSRYDRDRQIPRLQVRLDGELVFQKYRARERKLTEDAWAAVRGRDPETGLPTGKIDGPGYERRSTVVREALGDVAEQQRRSEERSLIDARTDYAVATATVPWRAVVRAPRHRPRNPFAGVLSEPIAVLVGSREATPFAAASVQVGVLLPVLIGLGLMAPQALAVVRARRQRAGRCVACGYDMRASPERCPECGLGRIQRRVPAPGKSSAPSG